MPQNVLVGRDKPREGFGPGIAYQWKGLAACRDPSLCNNEEALATLGNPIRCVQDNCINGIIEIVQSNERLTEVGSTIAHQETDNVFE